MEEFLINVAPAKTQADLTPSLDDLQKHAQLYYQGADIVWMLLCSGLVFQMVPAMCLFYSGATTRTSSLKLFRLPLITAAVIGCQWYLWGYALTFTPAVAPDSLPNPSWYGWDPRGIALHDSTARPVGIDGPQIPELVYEFYESMFASFTAALVCGGATREDPDNKFPSSDIPVGRFLIFISLWSLLVYYPVARWTWHWAGWSNRAGVMDFAGGTAVHITSGTAVLAFYVFYAIQTKRLRVFQRKRQGEASNKAHATAHNTAHGPVEDGDMHGNARNSLYSSDHSHHEEQPVNNFDLEVNVRDSPIADKAPHNVNNIVLGTALLWIGWFGFNGGSALGGNLRAVSACVSTHVAACTGGTCMLLLFWGVNALNKSNKHKRTTSVTHFCDGAVIALVAITPGAGFVPVWSAGIFGVVSTIVIFFWKWVTARWLYDEPLYVFAIHAGGGFVGMILTGAFADPDVVGLDGYSTLVDRSRGARVGYQIADALAGFAYTFCMTMLILYGLRAVRFLARRGRSAGFEKPLKAGSMKLQATLQHEWFMVAAIQPEERGTDPSVGIAMEPLQHGPPNAVA